MKKMSIKERVKITARGFSILRTYCPGLSQGKAIDALVSSLVPFAGIWFSARIINEIAGAQRIHILVLYVCAVALIHLAGAVLQGVIRKITDQKESQMWDFFGKIFADKRMSMDYTDLENPQIQQQGKIAEENLFMFGNGLAQLVWGTAGLVTASVNIIVSFSMTVTLFTQSAGNILIDSPIWIAVLLGGILLGGLCNYKATVIENKIFKDWCTDTVWLNRTFMFIGKDLSMNIERAKDVRLYEQARTADPVLEKMIKQDRSDNTLILKMSFPPSLAAIAIGASYAGCYLYVALKAFLGAFGVGSIVQYVGVLSRLGDGIQELMYMVSDNEVYCTHLKDLFAFLDIPNKKYQGTLPIEKRDDNDYFIEFRDVSFRYPNTEAYALRHVNLKVRVGEKLAVVGMNGSGKTTFIKLLCRLYDPTEGVILLHGVDVKMYDYDEYLSIFSVVFQDFRLLSFSLAQNVAASLDYDPDRVRECLNKAGLNARLATMPEGIETCLYKDFNEKGVEISGGEAQKVVLARALYKDAPFIVLDEPTAALDPIAEYEIYSKFNEIVGNKTAIYISHRLTSCRFCDRIAVFDRGQIIQYGSHDALVADKGGKYHELWYAQAQYYTSDSAVMRQDDSP